MEGKKLIAGIIDNRGLTYDKEFDLWYSDKEHDFAYQVKVF